MRRSETTAALQSASSQSSLSPACKWQKSPLCPDPHFARAADAFFVRHECN